MSQTKAQLLDGKSATIQFTGGSASAPSVSFTGDTNTGIYSPGADQVAISTGGSGRLFVASDGKIGIGSSGSGTQSARTFIEGSGACPLEIDATAGSGGYLTLSNSGSAKAFFGFGSNIGTASVNDIAIRSQSGALAFQTGGANERLRITSAGLVGVGTNSPSSLFHLSGNSGTAVFTLSDPANGMTGRLTADPTTLSLGTTTNHAVICYTNSAERLRIDTSGRVGIGTSAPSYLLQAAGTIASVNSFGNFTALQTAGGTGFRWALNNDGTFRLQRTTDAFATASIPILVDSSDRVGIGTTSPSQLLHVNSSSNDSRIYLGNSSGLNHSFIGALVGDLYVSSEVAGAVIFRQNATERARIDSSGRLLMGTSFSPGSGAGQYARLVVQGYTGAATEDGALSIQRGEAAANITSGENIGKISFNDSAGFAFADIVVQADADAGAGDYPGRLVFSTTADGASSPTERMRIISDGDVYIGQTSTSTPGSVNTTTGLSLRRLGQIYASVNSDQVLVVNRNTNDGNLVLFNQDGTQEGNISVSGTTVSYNGAHLSRWSQLSSGAERIEILRGSVLSNIDEMCEWGDEDNEQLNRMKVSDVEGDKNVSGVFQAWDDDDDTYTNDFYCAMTGDFIIRIAAGVTVERGDLLMSAGDGTAKPQDDDIIRSKTIAKVTSTNVSCTYDDGSYCVPCVLMAC